MCTHSKIYCENPQIIWHPHAYMKLQRYGYYQTPSGQIFHSKVAHCNKDHVTEKNIDKYIIINPATGEIHPMFLLVPCNKCTLCHHKKAGQWSFRALCEYVTSESLAYFLTLTYNDKHLPACGVFKEEIQLFMKRLRIHLDRKNIKHNIRYFAVSEYGKTTQRPHYHIILFNIPKELGTNLHSVLTEIEKAWQIPSREAGKILYNKDGSPQMESLGYAYCLPCLKGGINYVTKYMTKPQTPPKGKNPTFMLCSRKNGSLGSAYAEKYRQFYLENPDTVDISVQNILDNGKTQTMFLPTYYRTKYFPSESTLNSPIFNKMIKTFYNLTFSLIQIRKYLTKTGYSNHYFKLDPLSVKILNQYKHYHIPFQNKKLPHFFDITQLIKGHLSPTILETKYENICQIHSELLRNICIHLNVNMENIVITPQLCKVDLLQRNEKLQQIRKSALSDRMRERLEINLERAKIDVERQYQKYLHKAII